MLLFILTSVSDRYQSNMEICIGETQCLLLPSLVKALLDFKDEMKATRSPLNSPPIEPSPTLTMEKNIIQKSESSSRLDRLRIDLHVDTFEIILSSRDIPQYVDIKYNDLISVVTFRLKIDAYACYRALLRNGEVFDTSAESLNSCGLDDAVEQAILEYLQPREKSRTVLLTELNVSVRELQVLRTAIVMLGGNLPRFVVSPPIAGEQRITNAFNFSIQQHAALLISGSAVDYGSGICITHAIKINSEFVDVLVYISSRTGGMSDAIRVTVRPIFELLIDKSPTKVKNHARDKGKLKSLLEAAATIALTVDGLRFTFVPGGATQLTESPIIKFELSRVAMGCGLVPLKADTLSLPDSTLKSLASATTISLHHLTLGGWLVCEISASYHNRRLVAWEPFVEPWEMEVRLGVDFVRTKRLQPILGYEKLRDNPNFEPLPSLTPYETGSQRLKNIGRFLRFPFSNERLEQKVDSGSLPGFLETEIDLSFLLLFCSAREVISLAMLSSFNLATCNSPISAFPGSMPMTWLHQFGFPVLKDFDSNASTDTPGLLCWISDCAPLNVNLTGALIETLSEYSGAKTRRLAPHWIRNDSGLVSKHLSLTQYALFPLLTFSPSPGYSLS
jgi:hypothetical protein